jgi:hypothetical protein
MDSQAFAVAAVNTGIVSGLDLMHMPEVYKKLVGQYPKQKDLLFLQMMGNMKEVVKQTTWSWHEENRTNMPITIAAKATVIANTTVRITLAAADHYGSGAYSFPRKHDQVEFKNGAKGIIIAKDTSVASAHTVDIQRMNSDSDPVAAAVVGGKIGIFSMAFAEGGTGSGQSIAPRTTTYTAKLQIFRDEFSVTTSEQTNQSYVDFTWPAGYPNAGQPGKFYFIKAEGDTYNRFMKKRELGLLTNVEDDGNIIINSSESAIRSTRGFIPHVKQYSNLMQYATKPTMGTFDTMIRILNKNYSDTDNMCLMGLDFALVLKDFGTDLMKNGATLYNSAQGKAMDAVALGFSTFTFPTTDYNFHFKKLQALSDADSTGLAGFGYSSLAILCPTESKKDPNSGEMEAPISIRYKTPVGGGNKSWYKMWETGAGAATPTNSILERKMELQSEEGIQTFGAARFIHISKAS